MRPTAGSIGARNRLGTTPMTIDSAHSGPITAHSRTLRSLSGRFSWLVTGP